jgi:hypothetical protein
MPWKKLLAWATGQIDKALRQKLEFVLEENRVYRALLERHSPHWRLHDAERKVLTEKGKLLGKLLQDVITMVQPETLLKWHRQLVASKWDFISRRKAKPGRPAVWAKNSYSFPVVEFQQPAQALTCADLARRFADSVRCRGKQNHVPFPWWCLSL